MKRSIIASLLGITVSVTTTESLRGQGTVMFDNYSNPNHEDQVRDWWGDVITDTSVVIGLWAGQGVLSDSNALLLIATTDIFVSSTYGGGWYSGGNAIIPASIYTGTQTVTFQVRASGGTMFMYGVSALWQETPASSGGSLELVVNPANEMINGPLPIGVPEPSTFALAGLGVAGLLFFRRSK
jgi:hypothetical protein